MIMLIFMVSGMHRWLIKALAESFTLIGIGRSVFDMEAMYTTLVGFMAEYVSLGFRIGLPLFCVTLLTNGLLGIMAKVSPQMNMFAVGMQVKALIGLAIMVVTVRMLPDAADLLFVQMKTLMVSFIEAMGGTA